MTLAGEKANSVPSAAQSPDGSSMVAHWLSGSNCAAQQLMDDNCLLKWPHHEPACTWGGSVGW